MARITDFLTAITDNHGSEADVCVKSAIFTPSYDKKK